MLKLVHADAKNASNIIRFFNTSKEAKEESQKVQIQIHNTTQTMQITQTTQISQISQTMTNVIITSHNAFIILKTLFTKLRRSKDDLYLDVSRVNDESKEIILNLAAKYLYSFDKYKSVTSKTKRQRRVNVFGYDVYSNNDKHLMKLVDRHRYIMMTRDLINEPSNIATPDYICRFAKKLFKGTKGVTLRVFDEREMATHKLNLVNAIGESSVNKPRFLVIEYKADKSKARTFCLCGKGVTFDAGGTQMKTGTSNSYEMKGDKTGGCIVIGLLKYFADLKADCNLVGIIPLVENVVSGGAVKPGDIIESHSSKTVEILNTDAEGRLILADALSYAQQYQPDYVFDFATLTGWAQKLHCDTSATYFSVNKELHALIEEIGERVGERTWGMPRWLEYMRYCKSEVADLKNADLMIDGCSHGGGFMAAMFLGHFVGDANVERWVHFDICNTVDGHVMNANTMILAIHLIETLCK